MLSESFYALILTTTSAIMLAILGFLYKSKCEDVKCGCLSIHRDVKGEEEIDKFRNKFTSLE